jgi:hypothetical protein
MRKGQAANALKPLEIALDEESFQWMSDHLPELADAIEEAVTKGTAPERIRRFVMQQTARWELALRCEQCARHLQRSVA